LVQQHIKTANLFMDAAESYVSEWKMLQTIHFLSLKVKNTSEICFWNCENI
jgi:hypothetical protein